MQLAVYLVDLVDLVDSVYLVYLDNIYSFGMEVSRRWRLSPPEGRC
jgi:hypothetical protein